MTQYTCKEQDGVYVVYAKGEMVDSAIPEIDLQEQVKTYIATHPDPCVIVDMEEVP